MEPKELSNMRWNQLVVTCYTGSSPNQPQNMFLQGGVDSIADGIGVPRARPSYPGYLKHKTYKK